MSAEDEFERHARAALGESVTRIDARVRSRLNQARHAAMEELAAPRGSFWRSPVAMPATGAVAAVVLAALILTSHYRGDHNAPEAGQGPLDDIEILADNDELDLLENWDSGFYEWAAAESENADGTSG